MADIPRLSLPGRPVRGAKRATATFTKLRPIPIAGWDVSPQPGETLRRWRKRRRRCLATYFCLINSKTIINRFCFCLMPNETDLPKFPKVAQKPQSQHRQRNSQGRGGGEKKTQTVLFLYRREIWHLTQFSVVLFVQQMEHRREGK